MGEAQTQVFPVIRGIQASMEYYVTMCDLGSVPSIFGEIAEHNEGGQRRLNKTRLPAIEDYILNNRLGYVLPPIIASIDGTTRFLPLGDNPEHYNIGLLEIHKPFRFFINDGQHRIEAIKRAVRRHPELAIESIACVFFLDIGLQRRQQLFSDLNRHAVRATRSLSIFYDYRDPMADVARQTARQVPLFNGRIDMERDVLPKRSPHLFTLYALYNATRYLVGEPSSDSVTTSVRIAVDYWTCVCTNIPEWDAVLKGELSPSELREEFIHGHAVTLLALGKLGRSLLNRFPSEWRGRLRLLQDIDWRRDAPLWQGRTTRDGRIIMSHRGVALTALELARFVGVPLDPEPHAQTVTT